MTRHVHLTPLGGLAGDMFAAAMLSAFPDMRDGVLAAVAAVLPADHPGAALMSVVSGGLSAHRFEVAAHPARAPMHYPDLDAMIAGAALPDAVRDTAAALLRLLAEAEASVHGCPTDRVHFHEIADWDTLADLTAAAAILSRLDGAGWSMDPLPLGGGTVVTQHGTLPVPAPATAALLAGLPVHDDGLAGERVTPTGACIARYIVNRLGLSPRPTGTLSAIGRGAGSRTLPDRPNILSVLAIEHANRGTPGTDRVTVVEFDIDDMTAEEIAFATDRLRGTGGVLDLTTHSVTGKKGRTATRLRLLVAPGAGDAVAEACFTLTSTIGLRLHDERRILLPRSGDVAGGLRRKAVTRPGGSVTRKAESDDLAGVDSLAERRRLARRTEEEDGE
ncbi:MAG: hypothetical protein CMH12_19775 [Maritimibacter sp.]|nr:hypothetical protein [Maritimibacter sp.]